MKKRKPQIVWMVKNDKERLLAFTADSTMKGPPAVYRFYKRQPLPENYSVVRVELREVRAAK